MTGNFEVSDQDVSDLIDAINYCKDHLEGTSEEPLVKRLLAIRERLLKVEVNDF